MPDLRRRSGIGRRLRADLQATRVIVNAKPLPIFVLLFYFWVGRARAERASTAACRIFVNTVTLAANR